MTAATIRQRARKGKSERKGGNGSSEGRTRTEERANGRGREGGREGGQSDDDDWGPQGKLSGQGRRCGRPRPTPLARR